VLVACVAAVCAEVYYKENFDDGAAWTSRWIQSSWKKSDGTAGNFKLTNGQWFGDAEEDVGIQTSTDARFYAYSSKLAKPFSNKGKTLVLQFSVKHEQKIDCGGGYIKLLPTEVDQEDFTGDSPYAIMFGPDICGSSTKRVHVILSYKGKNLLIKKEIPAETDQMTHLYTLIVNSDNTYEVRIDNVKKESGSLFEDWEFTLPKKIKDPSVTKPSDWVDEPMIDDVNDVKPADYDSVPKEIADPEAEKPEDWDDEADGTWEAPKIANPEYKGEWKPKRVKNPAYRGKWVHPEIDNPEYVEDLEVYSRGDIGAVGFDLWQVKAGTIFDNIVVTDSVNEAEAAAAEVLANKEGEKAAYEAIEAQTRATQEEERKAAEAARKAKEDENDDEDGEDEDDEDHSGHGHDDEL